MKSMTCLIVCLLTIVAAPVAGSQNSKQLNIIWHAGALGNLLEELSEDYTKQSGVVIKLDLVPWADWHDTIAADLASQQGRFDLVIFDSQSMSEFASKKDVVVLNSYLEKSKRLKVADFDPRALATYAEYPEGSSTYYALPVNQDVMGLVYRKDLFENSEEREKFKEKYGYDLQVPRTYDQLADVAEFFTRPEVNLYGIALYGSSQYDAVSSVFNNVLWSFGGRLWDPIGNKAAGVINAPRVVAALEYFKQLFNYAPPGATDWYYDEVNHAIKAGEVALGINWYYFFNTYLDPKESKVADAIGFAPLPGHKDAAGQFRQYNSVGGQGISISKHSRNVDRAWEFLEWLMSRQRQWQWVRGGGQTGRIDILESTAYERAALYNAVFPISMSRVKDYWHLVEYPQLLAIYQKYLHRAIIGSMSPKEALDRVASEQQAILDARRGVESKTGQFSVSGRGTGTRAACDAAWPQRYRAGTALRRNVREDHCEMNELEIVGTFESRPGNPAVTVDGRKLVSMQPIDNPRYRVVELLPDGAKRPFPNEQWAGAVGSDGVGMQAVIGIRADTRGIVWMLDMGDDGHAPKLVGWDAKRDVLERVIVFPASASRQNSFHQDLAIDTERNMAYVADMTLGGVTGESLPAIVVVDLDTGLVRRVLEGNAHFAPGREKVVIDGNTFATRSERGEIIPIYFGLNPITIDPKNEWVYFGPINGKGLFKIAASKLADSKLSDAELNAAIEPYGEKRSSDGISVDDAGNVYVTDVETHAIGVANPKGYTVLVKDTELLKWPDGLAFGPDGWLYVTANQLNLHPDLNGGNDGGKPPFYLLRVKPLAAGSVGR